MDHKSWLSKSAENLAAAQLCFDNHHFNACANRLYYAMFHAGAAALMKNGIAPPNGKVGHAWLQSNFSSHLIHRRKVVTAKFKSHLSDAYWIRAAADYKTESVSKKVAFRELRKAQEFVNSIQKELSDEA